MKSETAIEGIMKLREIIHKNKLWQDPNALSDVALKLSVYNSYLSDEIAPLHKSASDKAYAVFTECIADNMPVTRAEHMSRGESTSEREDYEKIQNIYKSTGNLITVLQSRLKVIQNQMAQEGVGQ